MPSQSVRFSADAEDYNIALSPTLGTTYTVVLWARLSADRNSWSTMFGLDNGGETGAVALQTDDTGTAVMYAANGGTDFHFHTATVGTWYCYSVSRSALSGAGAIRVRYGTSPGSLTTTTVAPSGGMTTATYNLFRLGESGWATEWLNGNIAFAKVYTRVLSDGEIEAELGQYNPLSTTGLYAAYSFWDGPSTADLSGNGRTLTGGSGTSAEAGPAGIPQTAAPPPGSVFNLDDWKITLPSGPANDATEVTQPTLETYADANFQLDGSNRMVMTAPVQGSTTSGSGGTRCELREMEGGSEADWDIATTGTRQLTVSGIFDPTNITDRKEMIVGQIHGTTGTPPIYLTVEHHVASPRLRIFKDGPGLANVLIDLTSTTEITYRLRVESGRVKLWAAIGGVSALPAIPQYDWAAADFTDNTGCYFKAGSYNKSEVADLGTGSAIATITHLELLQPGDTIPPIYPERGRFLLAY